MDKPMPNTLGEQWDLLYRHRLEQDVVVDLGAIGRRTFQVTPIGNTGNLFKIEFRDTFITPVKARTMTDIQGHCHTLYEQWVNLHRI